MLLVNTSKCIGSVEPTPEFQHSLLGHHKRVFMSLLIQNIQSNSGTFSFKQRHGFRVAALKREMAHSSS